MVAVRGGNQSSSGPLSFVLRTEGLNVMPIVVSAPGKGLELCCVSACLATLYYIHVW
jgi:hypothetical protein